MVRQDGFFRCRICCRIAVLLLAFISAVLFISYMTPTGQTETIYVSGSADELIDFLDNLDSEALATQNPLATLQKVQDSDLVDQIAPNQVGETENKDQVVDEAAPEIKTPSRQDSNAPIAEKDALNSEQPNVTEPVVIDQQQQAANKLKETVPQPDQSAIPYILHWSAPSEMLPDCYKPLIESCTSRNPDWRYYLWRDQDKREFMRDHYPLHSDWLLKMSRKHQEKLFRYFVLMKLGGLFLDLDMQCVSPLTPVLSNISIFLAEERPEISHIVRNENRSIDDTVIAGAPGHRLFSLMLEYLAELPDEPVNNRGLLATACASLKENCTLSDYRYFGSSLDKGIQWRETCTVALGDLNEGIKYKQDEASFYQQQACVKLRDQNWLPVNAEVSQGNNRTVAYHEHLTWENCLAEKQILNNITESLEPKQRVLYYA